MTAPLQRPQRSSRPGVLLLLILLVLVCLGGRAQGQTFPRVVAVGDIHGEFTGLVEILESAGLIDSSRHWAGGETILVQTGDFLDRGADVRAVMDLLMRLEGEASQAGGRVLVLLGNHEVMNLMGEMRDVSPEAFSSFIDQDSEKRRRNGFRDYLQFLEANTTRSSHLLPELETAWMKAHPPGYLEYRNALGPRGKYGRWLRDRPAAVKIQETLFLHAGIHPELTFSLEEINRRVRGEIQSFDKQVRELARQRVVHPGFDLEEMVVAVRSELEKQPSRSRKRDTRATLLEDFLNFGSWVSVHSDGPLWFRGYARWTEAEGQEHLPGLLVRLQVKHLVVAHTPQLPGQIQMRFGGRVILIDTGMLSSVYQGGTPSALEIHNGTFTAIYPDHRRVKLFTE